MEFSNGGKKTAFQISMIHESRNMPAKLLRLIDFHCFPHFQYAIHFTMLFYRAVIVLPGHFIQKEIHSIIIITCAIKSKWRLLKWNNDYDDCNKNQYFAPSEWGMRRRASLIEMIFKRTQTEKKV